MPHHLRSTLRENCSSTAPPPFTISPRLHWELLPHKRQPSPCHSRPSIPLLTAFGLRKGTAHNYGLGLDSLRPPNCLCQARPAHSQQPAATLGWSSSTRTSNARCSFRTQTPPSSPYPASCRIGRSLWFFLSTRKSRGDLARHQASASCPSNHLNSPRVS